MAVKSHIVDPVTGLQASVVDGGEKSALVVATCPLKTFDSNIQFFLNPTYGVEMNQDASFGGVAVGIHNGIDDVLWTGTAISGTWDFASGVQFKTGAAGIEAISAGSGGHAEFAKGGDQDLTGYVALSGWIYITQWGINKYLNVWCEDNNVLVGNSVNIEDYVPTGVYNTWHQFQIPLDDLGVADLTIDEIHFQNENVVNKFYLDDIQIEQTGGGIEYVIEPPVGYWFHVRNYRTQIVNNVSADNTDSTMPHLAYDSLLGESFSKGYLWQSLRNGEVKQSAAILTIADLLQYPQSRLANLMSDGTNTMLTLDFDAGFEAVLKPEEEAKIRVVLQDNFSGFLRFRIAVGGFLEARG